MSAAADSATLAELAAVLLREIETALRTAAAEAPSVRPERIVLRLGQKPAAQEGEGAPDFFPPERYPGLEKGWELEVVLGDCSLRALPLPSPPTPARTPLELFAPLPLTALKGMDLARARLFGEDGIAAVGHLAELSEEGVSRLCTRARSVFPREMKGKTRLLETPLPPIPPSSLDGDSLHTLLSRGAAELMTALGTTRSTPTEAGALHDLLEILAVALDSRILRRYTLGELRKGREENPPP